MILDSSNITLCTWNAGGIMSNVLYLQSCLRRSDICVVQEHWLYPDSINFLASVNEEFTGWGRSSDDLNLDSIWRRGKGGIGILWRKCLDPYITRMSDLGNDRIIVIRFRVKEGQEFFIIGVYFPPSNHPSNRYMACLSDLEDTVHRLQGRGTLFILGDFNAHIGTFGGPRSFSVTNERGKRLIDFMDRMNFKSVNSQHFCSGPVETFYSQNGSVTSTTDHVLVHMDTLPSVIDGYVQSEHPDNLSFHLPIFFTLDCIFFFKHSLCNDNGYHRKKLSWKRIVDEKIRTKYQVCLNRNISAIQENKIETVSDLESTISQFNEALVSSAQESIPKEKFKPHLKPYWNDNFKQLHYDIRNHRREWIHAGRPRNQNNMFFSKYKDAKKKFRRELRRKAWEYESSEYVKLQRIFEVDKSEFHKRISKSRNTNQKSGNVLKKDGKMVTDKKQVLEIWKEHYQKLYTPLDDDKYDEGFRTFVDERIKEYSVLSFEEKDDPLDTPLQVEEVANICRNLPNGKAGGLDGVQYEHIKYGGYICWETLTRILNCIRELEELPESTVAGMIISLFKGKKKSKYDKDSYRGITLLNVIGKIFERLILERNLEVFRKAGVPNNVQFAYQKSNSCIMASFVLQEAVNYYNEAGSNVYCCFLDSSKAFDSVWIDGLFFKLFNMGVKGKTWRILRNWFSKTSCCVLLDGLLSELFPIKQGIRQGGVLSPWLYMCYNNDITELLDNTGCGLVIEPLGVISNITIADDVTLLSSRVNGLQTMIQTMEEYANKWRFNFNLSKTAIVTFGESSTSNAKNKTKRCFYMYNQPMEEYSHWEHAGMILSGDFSSSKRTKHVTDKGKEVVSSLMSVGIKPSGLNPICSVAVWKNVGLAKMLYGSQLWWNLTKADVDSLDRVNRLAAKRMQGLCSTTRSEAAIGNVGLWTIDGYVDKMKLLFLHKLVSSSPTFIHKQFFVKRLFEHLYRVSSYDRGYVADIFAVLGKYDLKDHLLEYAETGAFPTALMWKTIVNESISRKQVQRWKDGIHEKPELELYGFVQQELEPLKLWAVALRNPSDIQIIANAVNVISGNVPSSVMSKVLEREDSYACTICGNTLYNVPYHFIMDCPAWVSERQELWDTIQDQLPVEICAKLFNGQDKDFYINLFNAEVVGRSKTITDNYSQNYSDILLLQGGKMIMNIFTKITLI